MNSNQRDCIGGMCLGFIFGIVFAVLVAMAALHIQNRVCSAQNWEGAACQARITLGYGER